MTRFVVPKLIPSLSNGLVVEPSPRRVWPSQRDIWRQIADSSQSHSMIVCGNCRQHPLLEQTLATCRAHIPDEHDVIILGGYYGEPSTHIGGHIFRPQQPVEIHGYIIRPEACRKLLHVSSCHELEAAWSPRNISARVNAYAVWPNLIFPQSGDHFSSFSELGVYGGSRFGNQLFQVAATIGAAARNGYRPRLPIWKYAKYFDAHFDQTAQPPPAASKYVERQFHYNRIPDQPNTDIVGFFQSPRYFAGYENLIRGYFRPCAAVQTEVLRQQTKLPNRPTVALHIRRGDYLSMPDRFRVLPVEYYRRAMEQFGSGEFQFAIFGDDPAWAAQTFRGDNIHIIQGNHEVIDLYLMASCDHQIIANSSFSWWGAWLNTNPMKRVIAPDPWFGPAFNHDTRDLLPPEWIKLHV